MLFVVAACGDYQPFGGPLPFPTPAQHDLVVLTRPGALTYTADEQGNAVGIEHDLAELFAQELGVGVRFVVVPPEQMEAELANGRYHLAAAWLSPHADEGSAATPPLFQTRDILAQHEASLPLTDLGQLQGKTVHAMAGTRQAATMQRLSRQIPDLKVVEVGQGTILDLLESLGERQVEYVAIDQTLEEIANQYVPSLRPRCRSAPNSRWSGCSARARMPNWRPVPTPSSTASSTTARWPASRSATSGTCAG
jgi:membrane-bound lytic murein transglycosylase F